MDSELFDQASGFSDCYDHKSAGNNLDLTLKLGLPTDCTQAEQCVCHLPMACPPTNLNLNVPFTQDANHHRGERGSSIKHYTIASWGGAAETTYHGVGNGEDKSSNTIPWSPEMGNIPHYLMNSNGVMSQYTGSRMGIVTHPNTHSGFGSASLPTTAMIGLGYTILETPRRSDGGNNGSSSVENRRGSRRQRERRVADYDRRCTNYYCNTKDTPMWRKGPLGPKTLCNACGIKYRKEKEKRRVEAAANKMTNDTLG